MKNADTSEITMRPACLCLPAKHKYETETELETETKTETQTQKPKTESRWKATVRTADAATVFPL